MIKTGFSKIDEKIGGFPEGSSILILGEPKVGKTILSLNLAFNHLTSGGGCIYLTTDDLAGNKFEVAKKFGWRFADFQKIRIIDAYLPTHGKVEYGNDLRKIVTVAEGGIKNLVDMFFFFTKISQRMKEDSVKIIKIFDSLSPLILHHKFTDVVDLVKKLVNKNFEFKDLFIFIVEGGIHENKVYETLKFLNDYIVEMEKRVEGKFMRIYGRDIPELTFEYKINENGISIE